MQKVYSRINWENDPSTNTPLSEDNLNKMDYALDQIDNRVVQLAGYQDRVSQSEKNAKTSEENAKVSEINAKQSELKSKEYMESAFKGTPEGYQEVVEKVDSMEIKTTKENTIKGTKNGGFRLTNVKANTIQNGTPSPSTPIPMLSTGDCVDLAQGCYGVNGAINVDIEHICSANHIPCKAGDVVKVVYGTTPLAIGLGFFDKNNNLLSAPTVEDTNVCEGTAPTGTKYVIFNIKVGNGITPSNAGKITLTINGKYLNVVKTVSENIYGGLRFANDLKNSGATVLEYTDEYITLSANEVTNKFAYYGNFKENTRYTFFTRGYNNADGYTTSTNLTIFYTDGTYTMLAFNSDRNCQNVQVSDEGKTIYFITGSWHAGLAYIYYDDFGIMEGVHTLEDFVPYKETSAYFLTTYPMIKGSTLFRENGLVKAMHCAKEKEINGNVALFGITEKETGNVHFAIPEFAVDAIPCDQNNEYAFSDYLSMLAIDTNGGLWTEIPKTVLASVDANSILAWFSEHLPKVQYPLKTPIIETLDPQSQIALNGLETFEGVTIVEFDSRVQPLEFEAEVGLTNETARLLKNELRNDTLEVKYNELAVAIVSQ